MGIHKYNPKIHHRQSIRLKNYDYSRPGYYFITSTIHEGWVHLFGDVIDGKMELNEFGTIASDWIEKIPIRYDGVTIDTWVVMPNHVHSIVHIVSNPNNSVGAIHELPRHELPRQEVNEIYRKTRRVMTIPKIMGYYHMNTAKLINVTRNTTGNRVWQRNYWEHVIRDDKELFNIRRYIENNPQNWPYDKLRKNSDGLSVHEDSAPYAEAPWMI